MAQDPHPPHRPGPAGWQKVVGLAGLVVIIAVVALLLLGEGHGPGRHAPPERDAGIGPADWDH